MSKYRKPDRKRETGFDEVNIVKADGTVAVFKDIATVGYNSEARYRQDVVMEIRNNQPVPHITGKLVDGKYVIGALKDVSIVHKATIVVLEPFDKPVKVKVGAVDAPVKYVAEFDCTQAVGTMVSIDDCKFFVQEGVNDDVVAEVSGTDNGNAGRVAIILEVSKLGTSTFMPSN